MQSSSSGRRRALFAPVLAVTFALTAPLVAVAQSDTIAADGTGVARISVIQGNVGVQRGDSAGALAAVVNAPVLGGDYITTGDRSRAEIDFDGSTRLRLDRDVQLRFTQLDTSNRTLQLAQGAIELRLLQSTDGTSEIDTPSISIRPQSRGAYRVSVTGDGQTSVTVRSGQAEVDTPQGAQTLESGATLVASGSADNPSVQTIASLGPDDFDQFNSERDRIETRAFANVDSAYVNTDIGGVEDLDTYGRWVSDGSYGHVWVPASVGADWAPYRDGRWVWEDGYGWTWVASEPWGWAPYHYGSWYHSPNYGWCWYPPQPRVYVPWRPALVAFIGFGAGPGLSLGFGGGPSFGNIGWVPLAPHEDYHPWWGNQYGYGGNTTIVNNVTNITNVTNVTNINVYRNVRHNAVSGVTSQRFLQGNFVHNSPIAAAQLQRAQVFHSALPIVPTAANLRFAGSAAHTPVAVHPALEQRAFAGNANVVRRTSFADQRVAFAHVTHAPLTPLHFENARTTPVVGQHIGTPTAARVNPQAAAHTYAPNTRRALDARSNPQPVQAPPTRSIAPAIRPSYATPAHGAAGTDPWARFNESRSIQTQPRHVPGTAGKPIAPTVRSQYHELAPTNASRVAPAFIPRRAPASNGSSHQSGAVMPQQPIGPRHLESTGGQQPVHVPTRPAEPHPVVNGSVTEHAPPAASHNSAQPHPAPAEHPEHPPAHERRSREAGTFCGGETDQR